MNSSSLLERLRQIRSDLTGAERRMKALGEACDDALSPQAGPRRKTSGKKGAGQGDVLPPDPFRAQALALEAQAWLSSEAASLRSHVGELLTAATRAAERMEIDFFAEIEREAKNAGLACRTSPKDGEITVECYVSIKVDFTKGTARVNQRALASPHLPRVWHAALEEIEALQHEAIKPEKFVTFLSRAVQAAARRLHGDATQPAPIHEVFHELLLIRQSASALSSGQLAPYPRQLFALELSLFADARPAPVDATGFTVSLEPTTLPHQTVLIYSRSRSDYQRIGRLQCLPARSS